jgi:hypothetical protein
MTPLKEQVKVNMHAQPKTVFEKKANHHRKAGQKTQLSQVA